MPEQRTRKAAAQDRREGKSPATQAGEYVREEIDHLREGKHGAKSTQQAIAIGLSKARRDGVEVKPSKTAAKSVKRKAAQDTKAAKSGKAGKRASPARSKGAKKALRTAAKSSSSAKKVASKQALSRQAKKAASKRTQASRSAAAKQAARTKGPAVRKAAAKKAARTRKRNAA